MEMAWCKIMAVSRSSYPAPTCPECDSCCPDCPPLPAAQSVRVFSTFSVYNIAIPGVLVSYKKFDNTLRELPTGASFDFTDSVDENLVLFPLSGTYLIVEYSKNGGATVATLGGSTIPVVTGDQIQIMSINIAKVFNFTNSQAGTQTVRINSGITGIANRDVPINAAQTVQIPVFIGKNSLQPVLLLLHGEI